MLFCHFLCTSNAQTRTQAQRPCYQQMLIWTRHSRSSSCGSGCSYFYTHTSHAQTHTHAPTRTLNAYHAASECAHGRIRHFRGAAVLEQLLQRLFVFGAHFRHLPVVAWQLFRRHCVYRYEIIMRKVVMLNDKVMILNMITITKMIIIIKS